MTIIVSFMIFLLFIFIIIICNGPEEKLQIKAQYLRNIDEETLQKKKLQKVTDIFSSSINSSSPVSRKSKMKEKQQNLVSRRMLPISEKKKKKDPKRTDLVLQSPIFCERPIFRVSNSYNVAGMQPIYSTTGDLNRDGYNDVVTADMGSDSISVFLATGSSNINTAFFPARSYPIGSLSIFKNNKKLHEDYLWSAPISLRVRDVNNDAFEDIVSLNIIDSSISVLANKGDGTFSSPPKTFSTGSNTLPVSFDMYDINKDGNFDIVTSNSLSDTFTLMLGNDDGSFGPPRLFKIQQEGYSSFLNPRQAFDPDLLLTNTITDTVENALVDYLLPYPLDASMDQIVSYLKNYNSFIDIPKHLVPSCIAIADVNHDKIADVIIGRISPGDIVVFLGSRDGSNFKSPIFTRPATNNINIFDMAVGYVNNDSKMDIVTANGPISNSIAVFLGRGDGTFGNPSLYYPQNRLAAPISVALIDLTMDGILDIFVLNSGSDSLSFFPVFENGNVGLEVPLTLESSNSGNGQNNLHDHNMRQKKYDKFACLGFSSIAVYSSHNKKKKAKKKKMSGSPQSPLNFRTKEISYDPYNMMDHGNSYPISFAPYTPNTPPKAVSFSEDFLYQEYYEFSNSNLNEKFPLGKSVGSESGNLGTMLLNLPSTVIVTDPESGSFRMINAHCHKKQNQAY